MLRPARLELVEQLVGDGEVAAPGADPQVGLVLAVVVGPAGHRETVAGGQLAVAAPLLGRVARRTRTRGRRARRRRGRRRSRRARRCRGRATTGGPAPSPRRTRARARSTPPARAARARSTPAGPWPASGRTPPGSSSTYPFRMRTRAMCGRPTEPGAGLGQDLVDGDVDAVARAGTRRSARCGRPDRPGARPDGLAAARVSRRRSTRAGASCRGRAPRARTRSRTPRTSRSPCVAAAARASGKMLEGVVIGERERRQSRRRAQHAQPQRAGRSRPTIGRVAMQVDHAVSPTFCALERCGLRGAGPGARPARPPLQVRQHLRGRRRDVAVVGDDPHLGRERLLVGIGHAGELGNLAGARLGVQPLHVSFLAYVDRGIDEDLDEVVDLSPDLVADVAVGRDRRRDRYHAVAGEDRRHPADAADVGVAVLLRESEPLRTGSGAPRRRRGARPGGPAGAARRPPPRRWCSSRRPRAR